MSVNITSLQASGDLVNAIEVDIELLEEEYVSQGVDVHVRVDGLGNEASTVIEDVSVLAGWSETVEFGNWGLEPGADNSNVTVEVEVIETSFGQTLDTDMTTGTIVAPDPIEPDISVTTRVTDVGTEVLNKDTGMSRVKGTGTVEVQSNVPVSITGQLEIDGQVVDEVSQELSDGTWTIGVAGNRDLKGQKQVSVCVNGEANQA